MSYTIPPDLQSRIDAQLATGEFSCEEEVLREAIGALERRQRGLQELRAMIAVAEEDVAAGRVGRFDPDEIKRDVRRRLAERGVID